VSELTKFRIIDEQAFAPYLEKWETFEWSIAVRDDFGSIITGIYNPGPALIEVIRRLHVVIDLSAEERKEIEQLEHADLKHAQDKLNQLVGAKARVYYGSLIEHFDNLIIPTIKQGQ